jgi:hypothetical protein
LQGYAANGLIRGGRGTGIGFVDTPITAIVGNFQTAASVTVTAPHAGWVLVNATGAFYHRAACVVVECRVVGLLRDTGAGGTAAPHILTSTADNAQGAAALTPTWAFQVPAGTRTFVFEVAVSDGTAASSMGVFNTMAVALYSPFGLTGVAGARVDHAPQAPKGGSATP